MLLAGDLGATKTLLGLFEPRPVRPVPAAVRTFATRDFRDLGDMVAAFLAAEGAAPDRIEAASVGVAGPVGEDRARLTNAGWMVAAADLTRRFGVGDVRLLNDLEATAWSLPVLGASELEVLQPGDAAPQGTLAIIAAGTGLGMALVVRSDGVYRPVASEGGHADFAPTSEREVALLRMLIADKGRAQWEDVISGPGLTALHRFTHAGPCAEVGEGIEAAGRPAAISRAAIESGCLECRDALDLFVAIYGAAAGNLALTAAATGGVYIGGGIAPRILPALRAGGFMAAFRRKAPMERLLARIPVQLILNPDAALLGAAVHANGRIRNPDRRPG